MNLSSWIAGRYLLSKRAGRFAPLLTITSVLSIAVGIMALIVILSVMRGFKKELTTKLLGFDAHITITKNEGAKQLNYEDIKAILGEIETLHIIPFVQGEVIAQSDTTGEVIAQGARVHGIDPKVLSNMEKEGVKFIHAATPIENESLPRATIGSEIVAQLAVHPDFHDTIELTAPLADVGPTGELTPNSQKFAVVSLFRTGMFNFDSKYIMLPIDWAKRLLGLQAREGWQIKLVNESDVPAAAKLLSQKLAKDFEMTTWREQNRKLFAALRLERIAMACILFMAILIASFSIVGVILLVSSSKLKDIAILKSIGMKSGKVNRVFLAYSALIGTIGSSIGLLGGLSLCFVIQKWPIQLPKSYYLDWLPVDLNLVWALGFAACGVILSVIVSLYPVRQTTKVSPIEVLRYE